MDTGRGFSFIIMRIRTIKPEFFTHDRLYDAEAETKLPLRIAFAGLWCAADRAGRFKWEPRRLGVSILPYDGIDFSRVLDALVTRGFLVKYRVNDAWFGEIPSFTRHQVINPRESESKIPQLIDADEVFDACPTRAPRVTTRDVLARGEGKGREGNREGKGIHTPPPPSEATECESVSSSPKPRERNPLFDALASATDGAPEKLTNPTSRAVGVALAQIRKASPDVTPEEITRRAANYRAHFRDATLTASALSKHWARCETGPRGAVGITPPGQRPSYIPDDQKDYI